MSSGQVQQLRDLLSATKGKLEDRDRKVGQLESRIRDLERDLARLQARFDSIDSTHQEVLRERQAAFDRERAAYDDALAHRRDEADDHLRQLVAAREEISRLTTMRTRVVEAVRGSMPFDDGFPYSIVGFLTEADIAGCAEAGETYSKVVHHLDPAAVEAVS